MSRKANRKRRSGGALALFIVGQFFKWLGIVLLTIILFGAITAFFVYGYAKNYVEDVIMPQAEEAQNTLDLQAYDPTLSSTMYDAYGNEMRTLYASENRKWVVYDDIPENLINATVAIEDQRFWTHNGVDWKRTLGAVYYMFTGSDVQGGSTITQQLIKNLSDNTEVTVRRKVLEIFSALEFDANHSKEETLELYLNNIYLGRRCYGIYTAAYKYFGKDVADLTLSECACLISITNNPSIYDPYNHPENNMKRGSTVLIQMYKQGYITEAEEEEALSQLGYLPTGETDEDGYKLYDYHEDAVTLTFTDGSLINQQSGTDDDIFTWYEEAVIDSLIDDLMDQYGYSSTTASDIIYSGGLSIYTCYDPIVQTSVDAVYSNPDALAGYESDSGQSLQSSITVVDNETGAVVAMAGGIGEKEVNRGWNRATDTLRAPGSSIKPLSVYAPAIEEGLITPYSVVDDTPFKYDEDGNAWPKNASHSYSGLTSIYTSMLKSLNTSAVKTLDKLGVQTSFDYLENNFGITSLVSYMEGSNGRVYSDIDYAPLALGGLTEGVSTYEMAAAYSTFPRDGIYIKPYVYTSVVDSDGNVLLSNSGEGQAAISEDTAYYINTMLEGVVTSGTGTAAQISGYTLAGKTGTTTNNFDRWFCGYSHYYTASVWIGYDSSESINANGNPAVVLWHDVMEGLLEDTEDAEITTAPRDVVTATYCTKSGMLATSICSAAGCTATGYYLEGDQPTEYCDLHEMAKVCKDCPFEDGEGYHLAGDYCPEESIEEVPVLNFFRDGAAASVTVSDSYMLYSWLQAQGMCTVHTEEWVTAVATQTIELTQVSYNVTEGSAPFQIGATSVDGAGNAGGTLHYESSNPSVATVSDSGVVTVVGAGTAQITITADKTQYAEPVTSTVTVIVTSAQTEPDTGEETGGGTEDTGGGLFNFGG